MAKVNLHTASAKMGVAQKRFNKKYTQYDLAIRLEISDKRTKYALQVWTRGRKDLLVSVYNQTSLEVGLSKVYVQLKNL